MNPCTTTSGTPVPAHGDTDPVAVGQRERVAGQAGPRRRGAAPAGSSTGSTEGRVVTSDMLIASTVTEWWIGQVTIGPERTHPMRHDR